MLDTIFQSTRSQRPRRNQPGSLRSEIIFQSTRSQRPRQYSDCNEKSNTVFQSTRSQRPRLLAADVKSYALIFQSTRSQRPRPAALHRKRKYHYHFNLRGRKDLDFRLLVLSGKRNISIYEVAKTSTELDPGDDVSVVFQSTRSQRPRHVCHITTYLYFTFQSTRSQRPRRWSFVNTCPLWHFNLRGRKDLDGCRAQVVPFEVYISIYEVAKTSTANPSKNQIPSPAKSISIIQPPHDYFHQIIISTLYFIHFSPKTGANPPANPWELTVRTN